MKTTTKNPPRQARTTTNDMPRRERDDCPQCADVELLYSPMGAYNHETGVYGDGAYCPECGYRAPGSNEQGNIDLIALALMIASILCALAAGAFVIDLLIDLASFALAAVAPLAVAQPRRRDPDQKFRIFCEGERGVNCFTREVYVNMITRGEYDGFDTSIKGWGDVDCDDACAVYCHAEIYGCDDELVGYASTAKLQSLGLYVLDMRNTPCEVLDGAPIERGLVAPLVLEPVAAVKFDGNDVVRGRVRVVFSVDRDDMFEADEDELDNAYEAMVQAAHHVIAAAPDDDFFDFVDDFCREKDWLNHDLGIKLMSAADSAAHKAIPWLYRKQTGGLSLNIDEIVREKIAADGDDDSESGFIGIAAAALLAVAAGAIGFIGGFDAIAALLAVAPVAGLQATKKSPRRYTETAVAEIDVHIPAVVMVVEVSAPKPAADRFHHLEAMGFKKVKTYRAEYDSSAFGIEEGWCTVRRFERRFQVAALTYRDFLVAWGRAKFFAHANKIEMLGMFRKCIAGARDEMRVKHINARANRCDECNGITGTIHTATPCSCESNDDAFDMDAWRNRDRAADDPDLHGFNPLPPPLTPEEWSAKEKAERARLVAATQAGVKMNGGFYFAVGAGDEVWWAEEHGDGFRDEVIATHYLDFCQCKSIEEAFRVWANDFYWNDADCHEFEAVCFHTDDIATATAGDAPPKPRARKCFKVKRHEVVGEVAIADNPESGFIGVSTAALLAVVAAAAGFFAAGFDAVGAVLALSPIAAAARAGISGIRSNERVHKLGYDSKNHAKSLCGDLERERERAFWGCDDEARAEIDKTLRAVRALLSFDATVAERDIVIEGIDFARVKLWMADCLDRRIENPEYAVVAKCPRGHKGEITFAAMKTPDACDFLAAAATDSKDNSKIVVYFGGNDAISEANRYARFACAVAVFEANARGEESQDFDWGNDDNYAAPPPASNAPTIAAFVALAAGFIIGDFEAAAALLAVVAVAAAPADEDDDDECIDCGATTDDFFTGKEWECDDCGLCTCDSCARICRALPESNDMVRRCKLCVKHCIRDGVLHPETPQSPASNAQAIAALIALAAGFIIGDFEAAALLATAMMGFVRSDLPQAALNLDDFSSAFHQANIETEKLNVIKRGGYHAARKAFLDDFAPIAAHGKARRIVRLLESFPKHKIAQLKFERVESANGKPIAVSFFSLFSTIEKGEISYPFFRAISEDELDQMRKMFSIIVVDCGGFLLADMPRRQLFYSGKAEAMSGSDDYVRDAQGRRLAIFKIRIYDPQVVCSRYVLSVRPVPPSDRQGCESDFHPSVFEAWRKDRNLPTVGLEGMYLTHGDVRYAAFHGIADAEKILDGGGDRVKKWTEFDESFFRGAH